MSAHDVANVVGLGGVLLGGVSTYIQFRRARTLSSDGISLTTWYQFCLMSFFWMSYGLAVHSFVVFLGSAVCLPMQIVIVAALCPLDHRATVVRASAFIFVCCALTTISFGWSAGVYGTGVAMVINRVPQILKLVRHAGDLGVSVTSWLVGASCSLLWIGYYAGEKLWAPLISTAGAMCGNLTIAALAAWRHRQVEVASETRSVRPFSRRTERLREALQLQA